MTPVFATAAPALWNKGIPAIPLHVRQKRPVHDGWSMFCERMPTDEEQKQWLLQFDVNNIGLPLGPCSNLIAIDFDYDKLELDEHGNQIDVGRKIIDAVLAKLPPSPWVRVGKKGIVVAYKFNGQRPKKFYSTNNEMVVEILSTGNQVVLPPSIHPETQLPYTSNANLADVYDAIPLAPENLAELIYDAVNPIVALRTSKTAEKFNATNFVPLGTRDVQMIRHAGALSRQIFRGEQTILTAMDDMRDWFDNKVEKKAEDNIDIEKGFAKILQFVIQDVTEKNKILPLGWDEGLTDQQKIDWALNFSEETKEWTFKQISDHIKNCYDNYAADSVERFSCIDFVVRKMNVSPNLSPSEIDRIFILLKAEMKISVSSLKNQLKSLSRGEAIEGISHTEVAEETVKQLRQRMSNGEDTLAYWNGMIWIWEGTHWAPLDEATIRKFIQENFGNLKMSARFSDHSQIVKVIKDILPKQVKAAWAPDGINFQNGFLTKDLELLPHTKEFGMTYTMPYPYDPAQSGNCPQFQKFLHDSWGHEEDFGVKTRMLQEAMCTTLFGIATSYQRAFLLYGAGGSGKSVLMRVISELVPDEARSAISPDQWHGEYTTAEFVGVLLNQAGELHESRNIEGKTFKEVVDGSEITGRVIYESPFKFRPKAAHWFASNNLPKSKDTSGGFNRRWLIFNFDKVVPSGDIIRDLDKRIVETEITGVVAWALQALPALVQRGDYTFSGSHERLVAEMSEQNSSIRTWLSYRVVFEGNGTLKELGDLHKDYWSYTASQGVKPLPPKEFSISLEQMFKEKGLGAPIMEDGLRAYKGVRLRAE